MSCMFFLVYSARINRIDGDGGVLCGVFHRTWVLLLGMSGLIILFWLLNGGEVLRYLVSASFP